MIVVSDTSPVLNLARIGRLDLLALLYHQVLIPSAVYEELMRSKSDLPLAIDLPAQPWLKVATANDRKRVQELREYLFRDSCLPPLRRVDPRLCVVHRRHRDRRIRVRCRAG